MSAFSRTTALRGCRVVVFISALLYFAPAQVADAAEEVNLYTDRQEVFLKPVLAEFKKETGIKVNVLFAKSGLLERLEAEGDQSPADVILALDIGVMGDFAAAGVLSPYDDAALAAALPAGYSTDYWVAVTRRARILFVPEGAAVSRYADLAAPENRGKVCMRPATHLYNIGLFADMISRLGEEKTRQWLSGIKANLARKPQGKDRTQIYDVAAGKCGIGVANSYYYFQMLKDPEKRKKIAGVTAVIPERAHINVTAAALAAHAPHRANALKLLRFLISPRAQEIYAGENGEFPVRTDIRLPAELAPYGKQLAAAAPPADIARYRAAASRLVEEIGLNR